VGVAGKNGVRIDAGAGETGIHLLEHGRAGGVAPDDLSRVVHSYDHGSAA
jgi:hypothetical protein